MACWTGRICACALFGSATCSPSSAGTKTRLRRARERASSIQAFAQDAEHPARQRGPVAQLLGLRERALDGDLHQIIGVTDIAGERAREASQSWQQFDDLGTEGLANGRHLTICLSYEPGGRFLPQQRSIQLDYPHAAHHSSTGVELGSGGRARAAGPAGARPAECAAAAAITPDDPLLIARCRAWLRRWTPMRYRTREPCRCAPSSARNRATLEADPNGAAIVRNEIVAFSPTDGDVALAQSAGFSVIGMRTLDGLDARVVSFCRRLRASRRRALWCDCARWCRADSSISIISTAKAAHRRRASALRLGNLQRAKRRHLQAREWV